MIEFYDLLEFAFEPVKFDLLPGADDSQAIFTDGAGPEVVFLQDFAHVRSPEFFLLDLKNGHVREMGLPVFVREIQVDIQGDPLRCMSVYQGKPPVSDPQAAVQFVGGKRGGLKKRMHWRRKTGIKGRGQGNSRLVGLAFVVPVFDLEKRKVRLYIVAETDLVTATFSCMVTAVQGKFGRVVIKCVVVENSFFVYLQDPVMRFGCFQNRGKEIHRNQVFYIKPVHQANLIHFGKGNGHETGCYVFYLGLALTDKQRVTLKAAGKI